MYHNVYLQQAKAIADRAIAADMNGWKTEACDNYKEALSWLEMALKYSYNHKEILMIKDNMMTYEHRIKTLQLPQRQQLPRRSDTAECIVCSEYGKTTWLCDVCKKYCCIFCAYICPRCPANVCINDVDVHRLNCLTNEQKVETIKKDKEIIKDKEIEKTNSVECKICFNNINCSCAIVPCGHTGFCYACVEPLESCPMCRKKIITILKLFY